MKLYQELLMDHYKHPRNRGTIKNPTFATDAYNPSCADSISMQGRIEDNILTDVAFEGKGCVISQATASLLTETYKGKPIANILALKTDDILKLIGLQLGPLRLQCALLPLEVLQAGIRSVEKKVHA